MENDQCHPKVFYLFKKPIETHILFFKGNLPKKATAINTALGM
jgi:hypothetical protein